MAKVYTGNFSEKINIESSLQEQWEIAPQGKGQLFLQLESDATDLQLDLMIRPDADLKLFVLNRADRPVTCRIDIHCEKDAHCQMGLLDMQDQPFDWNQTVCLDQQGAQFTVLSAQLCTDNQMKKGDMEVLHNAGHTSGLMRNFAVLLDHGQYEMVANGNIKKGCPEAQSHQATRVLTLGKNHTAKCIPLLLIDENEVQASHALTIGQPDQDQLYYLQSRGLTAQQAIGLLSIGYFLPVIDLIEDQDVHDALRKEMEAKVGLHDQA
ncbi:MAG: SufD family Fe-S cluster assembly protein [Erysipelotrichaceae bacterium]|nr:SufD family Fe-S cluster assembly protein [Erysipelotrichaceae bacterium]